MSKYNKNFGGLKVSFKGKVSTQQIIESLASNLIVLQENFGVEEFSGVNFYCQIHKDNESQAIIIKESNTYLGGLEVNADASYKTITEQEDGSKLYRYKKGINFEELQTNVEEKIKSTFMVEENYSLISKEEINRKIKEKENELRILQKAQEKKIEEERRIRKEKERIEKESLNLFREQVKKDFGIEEEEFKDKVSSIGALIAPHVIKKYLGRDIDIDEKYFRVTMRDDKTGKAGCVYIYNIDYKLVKSITK